MKEKIRIGINGFGRIGRCITRIALKYPKKIEIVAINDMADAEMLAYLLKYDSVHGNSMQIEHQYGDIVMNSKHIPVFAEKDPTNLPWKELSVDIVVESTGIFNGRESASKHLEAGAKKVIITAPAKNPDAVIVLGVNDEIYKPEHKIISLASCTTNCLAPVVKVLNDEYHVESAHMTTVHAYTGDQQLLDGIHKDPRRARAAAMSMIPTTTGAAKAMGEVIPALKGKIDGMSLRVPTPNVSLVDLVVKLGKNATADEINKTFELASKRSYMKNILKVSYEPLVSIDYVNSRYSAVVDALSTNVTAGGSLAKVIAWYDNEWGYSCRVVDMIKKIWQE